MKFKNTPLLLFLYFVPLFFSCNHSSSGESSGSENGHPFLKPTRENPIVKKHNKEYEKLRSQFRESLDQRNRFLTENELPPSVRKSYLEGWDRVIDHNLDLFLAIDHTGEQKLIKRFRSFENMLKTVNKEKVIFTPTNEQKDQYNSLRESLLPYRNQLNGWLVNNQNSDNPMMVSLEISIFELRKIASKTIEKFISISIVEEQYFTKYLDKKGEEFLMLVMNGTLKK